MTDAQQLEAVTQRLLGRSIIRIVDEGAEVCVQWPSGPQSRYHLGEFSSREEQLDHARSLVALIIDDATESLIDETL